MPLNRHRLRARHLALGARGEAAARRYYLAMGALPLARNWRCRAGELDLVVLDGETIVFVEVKTRRRPGTMFTPADNLSAGQRRRNFNASKVFFRLLGNPRLAARYELCELTLGRLGGVRTFRRTVDYLPPIAPEQLK